MTSRLVWRYSARILDMAGGGVGPASTVKATAALVERLPDRFLFGTDEVGPRDQGSYLKVYDMYSPLWQALTPATSRKVRLDNYARIFDEGCQRVRAWERANVH